MLVESGIRDFRIRNTAQGFQNPTNDWIRNPSSPDKESESSTWESGIHRMESRIQDYLGFPYTGRSGDLQLSHGAFLQMLYY